jgi:hypothetical protein
MKVGAAKICSLPSVSRNYGAMKKFCPQISFCTQNVCGAEEKEQILLNLFGQEILNKFGQVSPPSIQTAAIVLYLPADGKRGLDEDDRRLEVCHDFKMGKCNVCGLLCATLHWHYANEIA